MTAVDNGAASAAGKIENVEGGVVTGWATGGDFVHLFANASPVARIRLEPARASTGPRRFRHDLTGIAPRLLLSDRLVLDIRDAESNIFASASVDTVNFLRPAAQRRNIVEGYVDEYLNGVVRGWVWNPTDPFSPLTIRIFVNDRFAGAYRADGPRADLAALGKGDGNHGFQADVTEFFARFGGSSPAICVETVEPAGNRVPIGNHAKPAASFFRRKPRFDLRKILTPRDYVAEIAATPPYPKKVFDVAAVPGTRMPDPFAADYTLLALEFLRREASDLAEAMSAAPDREKEAQLRALERQMRHVAALAESIAAAQKLTASLPAPAPAPGKNK